MFGAEEGTFEIDIDNIIIETFVDIRYTAVIMRHNASIVVEDIDLAEGINSGFNHMLHLILPGNIRLDEYSLATRLVNMLSNLFALLHCNIGDDYAGPLTSEEFGCQFSHASGRTCNNCHF